MMEVYVRGDYKVAVNRESICDNYPIPRTEDLFATLSDGEKFTKLDLRNAYQQLLLDEESRKVLGKFIKRFRSFIKEHIKA